MLVKIPKKQAELVSQLVSPKNRNAKAVEAFHQGLERLGWTIGRNVRIDYRATVENPERARSVLDPQPGRLVHR